MVEATYILTIDDLMDAGKAVYGYESSVKRHRLERLVIGVGLIAIVLTQKPSRSIGSFCPDCSTSGVQ